MTMRSKQWYTKTSRLSNSFANNSIGCLPRFCVSNKIIGEATGGVKSAGVDAEEGKKGFPKGKKPQGSFPLGYGAKRRCAREHDEAESKFQIFLARICNRSKPQALTRRSISEAQTQ